MTKLQLSFTTEDGKETDISVDNLPANTSQKNIAMMFYNLFKRHDGLRVTSGIMMLDNELPVTLVEQDHIDTYFTNNNVTYTKIDLEKRFTTTGLLIELQNNYLGKCKNFRLLNVDDEGNTILIDSETKLLDVVKRSLLPGQGGHLSWYVDSIQDFINQDVVSPVLTQLVTEAITGEIQRGKVGVSNTADYALARVQTSFFKNNRGLSNDEMSDTYPIYQVVKSHLGC